MLLVIVMNHEVFLFPAMVEKTMLGFPQFQIDSIRMKLRQLFLGVVGPPMNPCCGHQAQIGLNFQSATLKLKTIFVQ